MKRLPFKPEFPSMILDGTKTATGRWKSLGLNVGDIVAAVTNKGKNPAWLTPAKDAFCYLRITRAGTVFFKDFTEEMSAKTTVEKSWYLDKNPTASDYSRLYYYEFEVVK